MSSVFFTLEELGLHDDSERISVASRAEFGSHSVLEINDLATLSELEPLWNELRQTTNRSSFCQSLEWLQLYVRHFQNQVGSTKSRLRVFVIDDAGDTSGIAVLIEHSQRGGADLRLPSIGNETLWPLQAGFSTTIPICSPTPCGSDGSPCGSDDPHSSESSRPQGPGLRSHNWHAITEHLKAELTRNKTLDLRGIPDPNGLSSQSMESVGITTHLQPWSSFTTISCRQDFDMYWQGVSPRLQQLISQGEHRLATQGAVTFERFRPQITDEADPYLPAGLYERCLKVALNDETQLPRSDSVLNDPSRHDFLRDLLPLAWRCASADLCLLSIGQRPIAFRFHTLAFGHLQTVWTGVDADFRSLPLTSVLLHRTLRDSFRRGDIELDLGHIDADLAMEWQGATTPLCRITVGDGAQQLTTSNNDFPMPMCWSNS